MAAENKLINISGADFNDTGSVTATVSVLVGLSGLTYIPIMVDASGAIITG